MTSPSHLCIDHSIHTFIYIYLKTIRGEWSAVYLNCAQRSKKKLLLFSLWNVRPFMLKCECKEKTGQARVATEMAGENGDRRRLNRPLDGGTNQNTCRIHECVCVCIYVYASARSSSVFTSAANAIFCLAVLFIYAQLCCISRSSGWKSQAIVAQKKAKQLKWLLGKQLATDSPQHRRQHLLLLLLLLWLPTHRLPYSPRLLSMQQRQEQVLRCCCPAWPTSMALKRKHVCGHWPLAPAQKGAAQIQNAAKAALFMCGLSRPVAALTGVTHAQTLHPATCAHGPKPGAGAGPALPASNSSKVNLYRSRNKQRAHTILSDSFMKFMIFICFVSFAQLRSLCPDIVSLLGCLVMFFVQLCSVSKRFALLALACCYALVKFNSNILSIVAFVHFNVSKGFGIVGISVGMGRQMKFNKKRINALCSYLFKFPSFGISYLQSGLSIYFYKYYVMCYVYPTFFYGSKKGFLLYTCLDWIWVGKFCARDR